MHKQCNVYEVLFLSQCNIMYIFYRTRQCNFVSKVYLFVLVLKHNLYVSKLFHKEFTFLYNFKLIYVMTTQEFFRTSNIIKL